MGANTLQTAKASLQILSSTVKVVPIPEPLKSAVVGIPDAVLQIITIVETAKGNIEDAKVLALYIATITDRTIRPLDLPRVTPAMQNRIREFQETLGQIRDEITILASGRPLRKWIFNYDRDASKLGTLKQRVADAVMSIQLETVIATGHDVEVTSRKQDLARDDQQAIIQKQDLAYQAQQDLIRKQQEAEIDRLIALLGNGGSGSSKKPPCLDGTRLSLLKWISRWIEQPLDDGKRGLCLIGAAGRGKSSVGASVAEDERTSKRLGAEFYFTVEEQDRNKGVIPVLARQLALWGDRRLRIEIASAVDEDRDIAQRTLEVQFKKLIRGPLETLAGDINCHPLVMIFDGLDEFTDQDATRLLRLIGQSCATLPTPVRFIITSRPEPHLLHQYDSEPLDSLLHIRSLDLEDVGEVEKDIEAFLKQELPQMVWGLVKQPSNWPGEERRIALIRLSGGLWIWVVTVARMLADRKLRDPEKQLNTLLLSASDMDGEYGHNTDLYAIYSQIMNRACPQDSHPELITLFRGVLGALCVAEAPINTHTLTSLLCLDYSSREDFADSMRTKVLEYLQAVLIIPDIEEDDPSRDAKPIQFVHKSFKDYLTDKKRCEARFLISIAEQQRWMAIRCLRRMEDLQKPNICDINPSNLNSEIGNSDDSKHDERLDIKGLIRLHISSTLQYACENWANHVSNTSPECDDVYAAMDMFTRTRLMYWLEVLSLLEMTNSLKFLVGLVEVWLKARPQQVVRNSSELPTPTLPCRIATFMTEGLVKIQAGIHLQMNTAHASPDPLSLRVRNYARRLLPEIPPVQQSRVSLQANSLPKESDISSLSLLQDLESFVNEFRIPISTSSPHIYHSALPFTPSHTSLSQVYSHLAEGGPKPRREHLQQWTPQIAQSCVAWSPDGEMIISGYYDGSLRLWDPSTGAPIGEAWKFHTNAVDCVAWSPNGKMIASGSIVRFQFSDPITGAHIGEAWEDVTSAIISIAWSPDSKWVVTGSMDRTVRIWDSPTRAHVTIAHRTEFVRCVTWSPDGRRIASGHDDGLVIHLWDPSLGAVVEKLWEVGDSAYGLAWSPDGNMIVSSSMYGTLRLWHAWTGEMIAEPTAGMDDTGSHAWCVAWSPDGTKIVSSHDATVRLWNASTREPIGNAWQGHTDDVRSLGWSADGQTVVSGSEDGTILWNYLTGDPVRLEQGGPDSHTRHVYRLAFAPNSNKIVTASFDGSLRLWDSSSGVLVEHPICQTAAVISLNFSLDEKYVISETNECRILWRVAGEETGLVDDTQVEPVSDAHSCVLKIDTDGWIRDPRGKRMFWLPDVLRPIGNWGRVVVNGNILAIEVPSIPIIDISAYASRF